MMNRVNDGPSQALTMKMVKSIITRTTMTIMHHTLMRATPTFRLRKPRQSGVVTAHTMNKVSPRAMPMAGPIRAMKKVLHT